MSNDPLLRYYEQELTLVRRALGQFEQQHPGHAERLNINQGKIEDPNLARLLDGVALLNANVEKKLAEQLPQVIEGLLSILYPSYMQVVPSIAYLKLDEEAISNESYTLPKGSQFSAESQGQDCTFTTISELKTTPYTIIDTTAASAPFRFNRPAGTESTTAVIQITLSTMNKDVNFKALQLDDLDFFVKGFENNADSLVELLLAETHSISISDKHFKQHEVIKAEQLKSRVSDNSFQFLPKRGNQFNGFQLISEFFYFKEKRQFFRLKSFGNSAKKFDADTIVLNFFMHSLPTEFMRLFDNHVFKLNIVPAINMFEHLGEPVFCDQRSLSVPINADSSSESCLEIIEVSEVFEITSSGEKLLTPLYKDSYRSDPNSDHWQAIRGSDNNFQLYVCLKNSNEVEFNKLYGTRLKCSNGKRACSVHGIFECLENIDLPGTFQPIYAPAAPIERERDQHLHWQFIELLNSNFISILHAENAEEELKRMLRLCSREQVSADEIHSIRSVRIRSQVSALRILGKNVFSPGTEIEITLDTTSGFLAFSEVLNSFFQQFCSFDRYIQLSIKVYGKDGYVKRYPKLHGSQKAL